MFLVPFLPINASARKGAVFVLRERELVKGGIHLSDTVKIRALIGTGIPAAGVRCISIDKSIRKMVVLLFPDIPACADTHCRQTLLQRGCPDIAVQMHTKDQSVFVDHLVGTGRVDSLSTQAGQKVLIRLSESWLLVNCLDVLPAF